MMRCSPQILWSVILVILFPLCLYLIFFFVSQDLTWSIHIFIEMSAEELFSYWLQAVIFHKFFSNEKMHPSLKWLGRPVSIKYHIFNFFQDAMSVYPRNKTNVKLMKLNFFTILLTACFSLPRLSVPWTSFSYGIHSRGSKWH